MVLIVQLSILDIRNQNGMEMPIIALDLMVCRDMFQIIVTVLLKTDPFPSGKRDSISLREKEKQIQRDLNDEIIPRGGEMTGNLYRNTFCRKPASSIIRRLDLRR